MNSNKKDNKINLNDLSGLLNLLGIIMVFILTVFVIILSYKYLSYEPTEVQKIEIVYGGANVDSVSKGLEVDINKMDSLLVELKIISNEINVRQLRLLENVENENSFNRLFTAAIAVIIALAGFFGFKSIQEVKSNAIKDAIEKSTETAKKEFDAKFTKDYENSVRKKSEEAYMTTFRKEFEKLKIEERLDKIEQSLERDEGDANVNRRLDKDGGRTDPSDVGVKDPFKDV